MKTTKTMMAAAAALALLGAASQANAGLLGSTVDVQYYAYGAPYNGGGSPDSFVANGTAQHQFFDYYTLTVTDSQIIYDYLSSGTWSPSGTSLDAGGVFIANGNLLSFAGAPPITSVTIDAATNMAGFDASKVTFNSSQVAVEWAELSFDANTRVVLNVNVAAVPEPSTYALMAFGIAALGAFVRRQRNGQA